MVLAPVAAQAAELPGTGGIYHIAGDGTLPAPAEGTVPAKCPPGDCIRTGQHTAAVGPDGTTYIADAFGVVLRLDGDAVETVVSGLDTPWGIDVDSTGKVYIAEYRPSGVPMGPEDPPHTEGAIWRYDPATELAEIVAYVPAASDVRVGPGGILYVASWNWHGTGGVWRVDPSGAGVEDCRTDPPPVCTQLLGSGQTGSYDSEGIALFADAQGNLRLYVAAYGPVYSDPFDGSPFAGNNDGDSCIWEIDLNQVSSGADVDCDDPPPTGYQVVQHPSFPPVLFEIPIPTPYTIDVVTDIEIDASGTLHVLLGDKLNELGNPFTAPDQGYAWGGYCPRVFSFRPGSVDYVRDFGDYSEDCKYGGQAGGYTEGAPAEAQHAYLGNSIALGSDRSLLFSLRNGVNWVGTARFKLYEIRDPTLGVAAPRIYFPTECEDGIDNNGDLLADWPNDPGCVNAADISEDPLICDDGEDNDGDGATDYLDDIGCRDIWGAERRNCSDGVDNEGDGFIDFDGGLWFHGSQQTDPDPECLAPWYNSEGGPCGAAPVQAEDDARGLMALAPLAIAVLALLGYGIVRNRRAS